MAAATSVSLQTQPLALGKLPLSVPLSSPRGKVSITGDGRGASRARLVPESPALRPGVQGPRLAPPPPRLPMPWHSWPWRMRLLGGRCQLGRASRRPHSTPETALRREHVRVPGVGHVPARGDVRRPQEAVLGLSARTVVSKGARHHGSAREEAVSGERLEAAPGVRRGHSWGQRPPLGAVTMAACMHPTSPQCHVGLGLCTMGSPAGHPVDGWTEPPPSCCPHGVCPPCPR